MNQDPPKWIIRLINFYCPGRLAEGIIGDIWEAYLDSRLTQGKTRAMIHLLWNTIRFVRPGILFRNERTQNSIFIAMLRTNFLIATRNMMKNKFYSFINISGLSLGIAFVLLVFLYVQNAFLHDRFHESGESIYRIIQQVSKLETGEQMRISSTTPIPLGKDLGADFPSIKAYARYITNSSIVRHGQNSMDETVIMVDPQFFSVFSFPVIQGNPDALLSNPNDLILSPEYARKFFGYDNPIGQSLEIMFNDSSFQFQVSGVVDPLAEVSSLPFNMVISFEYVNHLIPENFLNSYNVGIIENYVELQPGQDPSTVAQDFTKFFQSKSDSREDGEIVELLLQPLYDIYLNDEVNEGVAEVTSPIYAYILGGLGLLVLVIATMNFIMLTSSQALNRIKEFGVRKTMGAYRTQLFSQLIAEAMFVASLSSIIAVGLSYYLLPIFSDLAGKPLAFEISFLFVWFLIGLITLVSLVSGLLSSGFLIKVEAAQALKGEVTAGNRNWMRQGMIVAQFALSICLIIGTLVFRSQMHYINSKSMGFDRNQLLEISTGGVGSKERGEEILQQFKTLAQSRPEIASVSGVMNDLGQPWTAFRFVQVDESEKIAYFNLVAPDYISTMGLELVEGRSFREGEPANLLIVNEALLRDHGWQSGLEKELKGKKFDRPHKIIGVVKDFHYSSLHEEIKPLILALDESSLLSGVSGLSSYNWPPLINQIVVRSAVDDLSRVRAVLADIWNQVQPDKPFMLKFYDDILNEKYEEEQRYSKVIDYAAIFSVGIAWLGLLGLTRLTVQKRIKEVGIRKVLGSSPFNITLLISKRFLILVVVANLMAWPMAWYGLNRWLSTFQYKIDVNVWVFIFTGTAVVMATFASVSFQTIKAATINPVETLRAE